MGQIARRLLPTVGAVLLGSGIVGVSSASALSDAVWTGSGTTNNWSDGLNWGGSAPDASVGTLSFPDLPTCDNGDAAPDAPCYSGADQSGIEDDLGDVTANELIIDNAQPYLLQAGPDSETLTLNGNGEDPNVGLSAASAPTETYSSPRIGIPITLGADQTWEIAGGSSGFGLLTVPDVSGDHALDVSLSNDGYLFATSVDTGRLTIDGMGTFFVQPDVSNVNAVLPAAGVTIDDGPGLYISAPGVTSGPIDASAGTNNGNEIEISSGSVPEATLAVSGDVDLAGGTGLGFSIDGNDTGPGVDSSELTVAGDADLSGARLGINQGWVDDDTTDCVNLNPGNTYTVLATSGGGTISGGLSYWEGDDLGFSDPISEGQTSPTPTSLEQNCNGGTAPEAYINYGSTAITATIAAAPASTAPPTIAGTAQVGETLSATDNGTWSAYPAPTYAYQWLACTSGSCSPISDATGSSFTLTSDQQGDTIELQVTATNALGTASASSSQLGPVAAAPETTTTPTTPTTTTPTTPTTSTTLSTPTTPTATPSGPSASQIKAALNGIGHPSGRKAITAFIKSGSFKTYFQAPSGGSLRVAWTTVVTSGTGKHRKHKTVTIATATVSPGGAGKATVRFHLTGAGRSLLKKKPYGVPTTATAKFRPSGSGWTQIAKKFNL